MKKTKFIFDVDGTLTPSRQPIDTAFGEWFSDFCKVNDTYIVTGSDHDKTIEQLGYDICNSCAIVFNCSGNDVWEKGINTNFITWQPSSKLLSYLQAAILASEFTGKIGNHIELRKGSVNFSILGRAATIEQRTEYVKWDNSTNEREKLVDTINRMFTTLSATIGGETGIDIYPKGNDKSQILKYFDPSDKLYFFGDKTQPGGNDYPLASLIKHTYTVTSWMETYELLQYFQELGIAE